MYRTVTDLPYDSNLNLEENTQRAIEVSGLHVGQLAKITKLSANYSSDKRTWVIIPQFEITEDKNEGN